MTHATTQAQNAQIVLTTVSNPDQARTLAHTLVESRLAACVNIVNGMNSVYRWKGAVESTGEVLLIIKTVSTRLGALEEKLRNAHPYELPEFVVIPVEVVSREYLAWLIDSTCDDPVNL